MATFLIVVGISDILNGFYLIGAATIVINIATFLLMASSFTRPSPRKLREETENYLRRFG